MMFNVLVTEDSLKSAERLRWLAVRAERHVITAAACVVMVVGASAFGYQAGPAACTPPRYVVGNFHIRGPVFEAVALAIEPKDFTRDALRCLVSTLKRRYSHPEAISFMIFDSKAALAGYAGMMPEAERGHLERISHIHAIYYRDREREYLEIKPFGSDTTAPLDSHIDLADNRAADCKVSIRGRCLMTVDWLRSHPVSGTGTPEDVQLQAHLARDGRLTRVAIVEQGGKQSSRDFARWAANNLKTWRFEPAASGDGVDVAVTAVISTVVPAPQVAVEIDDARAPIRLRVTFGVTGPW